MSASSRFVGPIDTALAAAPPGHRDWFGNSRNSEQPSLDEWRDDENWRTKVRGNLKRFVTHAFRRPVAEHELGRLMSLVERRRQLGESYERAMQVAVQVVLVSPRFLFIGNVDEQMVGSNATRRESLQSGQAGQQIDEYELAARLSYFLWSSMPDTTLLRLAGDDQLRGQLESQVQRMLRDRRAGQFAANFTGQWLGTRLLAEFEPDEKQFGAFDGSLREAMAREAEMVFADVVRQNEPITTLITADFTYLNERLAKHYDLPSVSGDYFRRVSLADLPAAAGVRGGVLTMAGVLAVTSNPNRTSPVKRGKWVLGDLLGAEPPPPPPGFDSLDAVAHGEDKPKTIREQMELHRADPACAVCHLQMDAIGFALENYDPVGRWRTEDSVGPIDAEGELPTGETIDGVSDLRQILLDRRDAFRKCFTEKMLTYALGRGLEYYDECAVDAITKRLADDDDRIRTLILAIVESAPFQQRRGETPKNEE